MCAFAALTGFAPELFAQAVIFPQQEQPGLADVQRTGDTFTLSNDLLSASYTKKGNLLVFNGCEEMSLLPTDEIFKIQINNGEEVLASQMTLVSVDVESLVAKPDTTKAALRYPGKAIVAKYTYRKGNTHDLEITWRAVLRDGSHYLRTEMEVKANKTAKMYAIVPLMVTVDNHDRKAPSVVGNTRGAIVMSDHLFAGLESPTGFNSASSVDVSDMEMFNPTKWTKHSFNWLPGADTPEQILKNGSRKQPGVRLEPEQVIGARGGVILEEGGDVKLTFDYQGGNQGLIITGVDVMDQQGRIVAEDYHIGFSGGDKVNREYTLRNLQPGCYIFRYFSETKSEDIRTGNDKTLGNIIFDKAIRAGRPNINVVFDGAAAPKPTAKGQVSTLALQKNEISEDETLKDGWKTTDWVATTTAPKRVGELVGSATVKTIVQDLAIGKPGTLSVKFKYKKGGGGNKLNIAGVDLVDKDNNVVASEYHIGTTGDADNNNVYDVKVPYKGDFKLRYFAFEPGEKVNSHGDITVNFSVVYDFHFPSHETSPIQCKWSRKVNLEQGHTWKISAVVGLVAEGQQRRSVAAYVERERAVPWRAYPVYISWYELNINRNNAPAPLYKGNMTSEQCCRVVEEWKRQLYDKYDTGIKAFVWDDGWDTYGTWNFNPNFPERFDNEDALAKSMNSGIGCWLGPVGGYGDSGNFRRKYWTDKGQQMLLSNPEYYKVFKGACDNLMNGYGYDFRFFKFDGISDLFTATGPKASATGDEDAEAIISAEMDMRTLKSDIFFNTTVGTWASPFWFGVTDAVWRQEKDYGEIGNNRSDRERWITYRDRLVYQNFVQNSPMCPINCLMTHGFILANPKHGVSKDQSYQAVLREMRCAFACGSAMVELYNDFELMNKINGGALWADLAECIQWQEKNAAALADIHWVGGNPWNGAVHEIYGWAGWNGKNAVFTLRNGDNHPKSITFTLREELEIPAYVPAGTTITFNKAFKVQDDLPGFEVGKPISIDQEMTLTLPGSTVFVFDNTEDVKSDDTQTGLIAVADTPMRVQVDGRRVSAKGAITVKVVDLAGRVLQTSSKESFQVVDQAQGVVLLQVKNQKGQWSSHKMVMI